MVLPLPLSPSGKAVIARSTSTPSTRTSLLRQNQTAASPATGSRLELCRAILAFEEGDSDEVVVGWMAANSHNNFRLLPPAEDDTATIICFSVAAQSQQKGVATKLLEFALTDLPKLGYLRVQAAPLASGRFETWGYRGPLSLYQKFGFTEGPMLDEQHVLVSRDL
jgi:GNAT superfamily N-acetyltransferase